MKFPEAAGREPSQAVGFTDKTKKSQPSNSATPSIEARFADARVNSHAPTSTHRHPEIAFPPVPNKATTAVDTTENNVPKTSSFIEHPPISLAELNNQEFGPRTDVEVNLKDYDELFRQPLTVFSRPMDGDTTEYFLVGPRLTGKQTNSVLYYASPEKSFELDTDDLGEDWRKLYTGPDKRRERHAEMPGWKSFEASRVGIGGVIDRSYKGRGKFTNDPDDFIIPSIRWTTTTNGQRKIDITPLSDELRQEFAQKMPLHVTDPTQLNTGMGLAFTAAYAPENSQWPTKVGYTEETQVRTKVTETNSMGPTQMLALAFRNVAQAQLMPGSVPLEQDLQQSPFFARLEGYTRDHTTRYEPERPSPVNLHAKDTIKATVLGMFEHIDFNASPSLENRYHATSYGSTVTRYRWSTLSDDHKLIIHDAHDHFGEQLATYSLHRNAVTATDERQQYTYKGEVLPGAKVSLQVTEHRGDKLTIKFSIWSTMMSPERVITSADQLSDADRTLIKKLTGIEL